MAKHIYSSINPGRGLIGAGGLGDKLREAATRGAPLKLQDSFARVLGEGILC